MCTQYSIHAHTRAPKISARTQHPRSSPATHTRARHPHSRPATTLPPRSMLPAWQPHSHRTSHEHSLQTRPPSANTPASLCKHTCCPSANTRALYMRARPLKTHMRPLQTRAPPSANSCARPLPARHPSANAHAALCKRARPPSANERALPLQTPARALCKHPHKCAPLSSHQHTTSAHMDSMHAHTPQTPAQLPHGGLYCCSYGYTLEYVVLFIHK